MEAEYKREPLKKLVVMYIFEILKKHTDRNHKLNQNEISDILKKEFSITVERKAIHKYLMELAEWLDRDMKELGYTLCWSERVRMVPVKDPKTQKFQMNSQTGERILVPNIMMYDFYLERPFEDGELRLLADSLLFSPHVSHEQCKLLAEKLSGLSSIYFKPYVRHISSLPNNNIDSNGIFTNIEILDEAIHKEHKVSFKYMEYGLDKKKRAKKDADGKDKIYVVSPYQMAANEGKYYLICNNDKFNDISNFRIDRIKAVKILDEPVKPFGDLQWAAGKRLDLAAYMKEHIYMYSSDSVTVRFKAVHNMIGDIVEIFGQDVRFVDKDDTYVTAVTKTNELAMLQFVKRHTPDVVLLEPQRLRDKVKDELEKGLRKYE